MNGLQTLLGLMVGGICGLPIGFGCSLSLYWLVFILTYGQGELSNLVLVLLFTIIFSPMLIVPVVGAVVGAKIMKRKPV